MEGRRIKKMLISYDLLGRIIGMDDPYGTLEHIKKITVSGLPDKFKVLSVMGNDWDSRFEVLLESEAFDVVELGNKIPIITPTYTIHCIEQ